MRGRRPKYFVEKWGEIVAHDGYTCIPNRLIELQAVLGIDCTEMCILLKLMSHHWKPEPLPFPSKVEISWCIGMKNESSIRKHIQNLEKKGYIKRLYRSRSDGKQTSNMYDLSGLRIALETFDGRVELNA